MFKKSIVFILLAICLLTTSCSKQDNPRGFSPINAEEVETFENDEKTKTFIEKRAKEMNAKWDAQDTESEIAKLNNTRANDHLSDETIQLLLKCISLSEKTDGLLDITLYPLTRLWGFEGKDPKIPQDMLVSLMFSKCGMDTISVSDNKFTLNQFTMLNPSAVTKGYSADLIAAELEKEDCKEALIKFEDHVRTFGKREDGKKWNVALTDPFKNDQIFSYVSVDGGISVSTKGTFRNYFEEEGKRYCDIFDPRNGKPVDNDLVSVTVIGESGITADAFATACLIMGSKDAAKFYQNNEGFEFVMVLNDGKIQVSEGIADSITFSKSDQEFQIIKK